MDYTVIFICLFIVSLNGGLALKNIFDYAPVVGYSLGTVFLIFALYFAIKNYNNSKRGQR